MLCDNELKSPNSLWLAKSEQDGVRLWQLVFQTWWYLDFNRSVSHVDSLLPRWYHKKLHDQISCIQNKLLILCFFCSSRVCVCVCGRSKNVQPLYNTSRVANGECYRCFFLKAVIVWKQYINWQCESKLTASTRSLAPESAAHPMLVMLRFCKATDVLIFLLLL